MERLFLVQNKAECDAALRLGADVRSGKDAVLGIHDDYPYLGCAGDWEARAQRWEDFDVWVAHSGYLCDSLYGAVRSLLRESLFRHGAAAEGLAGSDCFQMPIVLELGQYHFSFIEMLGGFFAKHQPQEMRINERRGFIGELFLAFASCYGIPTWPIGT